MKEILQSRQSFSSLVTGQRVLTFSFREELTNELLYALGTGENFLNRVLLMQKSNT